MWQLSTLYNNLPADWFIFQNMMFADANTFFAYNQNMRSLMVDKLTSCEMVVFNRADEKTDKMELHKIVRGVSRKANICYEDMAGEIEFDQIEDPLPFDINAPVIDIKDEDFAIFYRDMVEEFSKYDGKKVRFKGVVATDPALPKTDFAVGRHVMTCCADDIAYKGVVASCDFNIKLTTREWVIVEGTLTEGYSKIYRGKGPMLKVSSVIKAAKPKDEVATFY